MSDYEKDQNKIQYLEFMPRKVDHKLYNDNSYVQTVPNHWRLLIIDDKSLPPKTTTSVHTATNL